MRIVFFIVISFIYPINLDQLGVNDVKSNRSSINNVDDQYSYIENIPLDETINPNEYKVGPGDKLSFNLISSDGSISLILLVSPTGDILIPNIGKIKVDNFILSDAIEKIKYKCLEKYNNAEIYINLSSFRQFNVKVVGPGINRGYLTVSPVHRLSHIYSEIMSDSNYNFSIRDIRIVRNNITKSFDLLDFFVFGNDENNPFIQQNDKIQFSLQKKIVTINGGINIPGDYELIENQSLDNLIKISGGFTSNADSNYIEITRFVNDKDYKLIKIDIFSENKNFILEELDDIRVRIKKDYKSTDYVSIDGQVKYPGRYLLSEVDTYKDIIILAGGFTDKADTNQLIINNEIIQLNQDLELERIRLIPPMDRTPSEKSYLTARKKITKGTIRSNDLYFSNYIKNNKPESGDEIIISEKIDYIEVIGAVLHPGRYDYKENKKLKLYINDAGGLSSNASKQRFLIKASDGKRIKLSKNPIIESGDVIFISSKEDYNRFERFKEILQIVGNFAALIAVIETTRN